MFPFPQLRRTALGLAAAATLALATLSICATTTAYAAPIVGGPQGSTQQRGSDYHRGNSAATTGTPSQSRSRNNKHPDFGLEGGWTRRSLSNPAIPMLGPGSPGMPSTMHGFGH